MKHPKSFASVLAILVFAGWMSAYAAETAAPVPQAATPPAELVQKANKGDVASMIALADIYEKHYETSVSGGGISKDPELAHGWFLKAAQKGDIKAQLRVANDYFYNTYGVKKKDRAEGMKWFLKAASKGSVEAEAALGRIYRDGAHADADNPILKPDPKAAEKWFAKAAAQGNEEAMYYMSGATADQKEAISLLEKSGEKGYLAAQSDLGDAYSGLPVFSASHNFTLPPDDEKAVYWYNKAATNYDASGVPSDPDDIGAQMALGLRYLDGKGVPQDYKKAAEWFKKIDAHYSFVTQQGTSYEEEARDALVHLGLLYRDGKGVDRDVKEAARWFRKAATLGSGDGWYFLGQAYEKGEGVAQDNTQAYLAYARLAMEPGKNDEFMDMAGRFPRPGQEPPFGDTTALGKKAFDAIAAKMTPAELAEAQRLCADEARLQYQLSNDAMINGMFVTGP